MIGGDNGSDGNVLKSKGDGTMEWGTIIINPTFSSFDYPGDDTALDPAGGQSLVINGGSFNVNVTVTIDGTTCPSITRNSNSQLTVTTPAKSAGSQAVVITNTDGGSASTNVSYNGIPAFTNAAGSLGSVRDGESINLSAAATEPDGGAITYAITSGALPSGVTLNTSTGAITGTAPSVSADTTSNFTVTATDDENQSTARAYSITVTPELPSAKFKIVTYTGDGTSSQIINVGFTPDFVWIKGRDTADNHNLIDSSRTAGCFLNSNTTGIEDCNASHARVTTNGFDTKGNPNASGVNYVAWCWKANGGTTSSNTDGSITSTVQVNNKAGISIVKWTGTGSASTVGHGLSAAPKVIIQKSLSSTSDWPVYHGSISSPNSNFHTLNSSGGLNNISNYWGSGGVTSSVFGVIGSPYSINASGVDQIAYCFTEISGFSKFGSYTGTGAAGNLIETGFEPSFIMFKRTDSTGGWLIFDNKRNLTNPRNSRLEANNTGAEQAGSTSKFVDFYSNGFEPQVSDSEINASGGTYIYMAFAEDPDTTAPTLADSFSTVAYTGTGSSQAITGLGFAPNLVWVKQRGGATWHNIQDTINGATKHLYTNSNNALDTTSNGLTSFDSDGFTLGGGNGFNGSSQSMVAWAWKADDNEPTINTDGSIDSIVSANANSGFSIVKFNGEGSNATIGHGLSAVPEMIIVKHLNGTNDWWVYNKDLNGGTNPASYFLKLNTSDAEILNSGGSVFQGTSPTSTVFYGGSALTASGREMIAYCFHSVSGYSKINEYTGSGSGNTQAVTTGFQPDWILIKDYIGGGSWWIQDSVRGDDKWLKAQSSNAETTVSYVDFTSTGFTVTGGLNDNSVNSKFIYMAFKIN